MKILGLDTSISVASVALSEDGRIVAEDFYPRQRLVDGATSAIANLLPRKPV